MPLKEVDILTKLHTTDSGTRVISACAYYSRRQGFMHLIVTMRFLAHEAMPTLISGYAYRSYIPRARILLVREWLLTKLSAS